MLSNHKIAAILLCVWAIAVGPASAQAGSFNVVYAFQGGSDANGPVDGLIDSGGTLYGVAVGGGTYNAGAVFDINPASGAEAVLYSFLLYKGYLKLPYGGVIDQGNTLFGTTNNGGASGNGTVYSIDLTTDAETIVHSLAQKQGTAPIAGLTPVGKWLYGVSQGTRKGYGTVFAVNPSTGAVKVIHTFSGSDGSRPAGELLLLAGKLYGTTLEGGAYKSGVLYSIDPQTQAETTVYSFKGGSNGTWPSHRLLAVNGVIYGTTELGGINGFCVSGGCGTIFMVNPATGTETVLYQFQSDKDGGDPWGGLIRVGDTLYGTTQYGGGEGACDSYCGTIYSFNMKTGVEKVLHRFNGTTDGETPTGELIDVNGTLYGTAGGGEGCPGEGCGVIFSYTP